MKTIDVANIKEPYFACNDKERGFVHLLVEGLPKHRAYKQSFDSSSLDNYYLSRKAKSVLAGNAGIYYRSLMAEVLDEKLAPFIMTREQRLSTLTSLVYMSLTQYDQDREPQQAAIAIKSINTMNAMTGDNAPSELNITGALINADLSQLSAHDATQQYKDMMRDLGARVRKTLEHKPPDQDRGGHLEPGSATV